MNRSALTPAQVAELARRIADRAVLADIECEAVAQRNDRGRIWYDTRPMLDPREQPDTFIDMTREALDYAMQRRLIEQHHERAHLVRILKGNG